MEVALALIVFAVLVLTWLVLPGSATPVVAKEAPAWTEADNLQIAPAEV